MTTSLPHRPVAMPLIAPSLAGLQIIYSQKRLARFAAWLYDMGSPNSYATYPGTVRQLTEEENSRNLISTLREYAKKHPDLAEILRLHGIL